MVAVRIQSQHSVLHPTLGDDLSTRRTQLMDQPVCVDVIERVASWDVWGFMLEDCGEIRIFSVEINKVCTKVPLLEHVAGSGQVVDPWCSLLRPCFIAVEPLSERAECQSRNLLDQGLGCLLVYHKAIDSVEQFLVSRWLQRRW